MNNLKNLYLYEERNFHGSNIGGHGIEDRMREKSIETYRVEWFWPAINNLERFEEINGKLKAKPSCKESEKS